jgi:hypothetical protein
MDTSLKILITGPPGSGKTTLVQGLSEVEVVTTDEPTGEGEGTTVALDYGKRAVGGRTVHLFGTPGQPRFAYMWQELSRGADGIVLLVNATRNENGVAAEALLDRIRSARGALPYVVGLTHADQVGPGRLEAPPPGPVDGAVDVHSLDARDTSASSALLDALVHTAGL